MILTLPETITTVAQEGRIGSRAEEEPETIGVISEMKTTLSVQLATMVTTLKIAILRTLREMPIPTRGGDERPLAPPAAGRKTGTHLIRDELRGQVEVEAPLQDGEPVMRVLQMVNALGMRKGLLAIKPDKRLRGPHLVEIASATVFLTMTKKDPVAAKGPVITLHRPRTTHLHVIADREATRWSQTAERAQVDAASHGGYHLSQVQIENNHAPSETSLPHAATHNLTRNPGKPSPSGSNPGPEIDIKRNAPASARPVGMRQEEASIRPMQDLDLHLMPPPTSLCCPTGQQAQKILALTPLRRNQPTKRSSITARSQHLILELPQQQSQWIPVR